jgi:hypothetical protein
MNNAAVHRLPSYEDRLSRIISPRPAAIEASKNVPESGDQRSDERQSSTLTGTCSFKGCESPIPCLVLDRSLVGARVKLVIESKTPILDATDLPVYVSLRLAGQSTEIICKVKWRMGIEFGCKFVAHY